MAHYFTKRYLPVSSNSATSEEDPQRLPATTSASPSPPTLQPFPRREDASAALALHARHHHAPPTDALAVSPMVAHVCSRAAPLGPRRRRRATLTSQGQRTMTGREEQNTGTRAQSTQRFANVLLLGSAWRALRPKEGLVSKSS